MYYKLEDLLPFTYQDSQGAAIDSQIDSGEMVRCCMDLGKEGWFSSVKILISASQGAFIDSQMDSGEMTRCCMDLGKEGWFSSVKILFQPASALL